MAPASAAPGVVTVSQVLQMAALLDGKHGLRPSTRPAWPRRGGPVISDVRIARERIEGFQQGRRGAGADLVLGLDLLGAANPKKPARGRPGADGRGGQHPPQWPTAAMVTDTGRALPRPANRNLKANRRRPPAAREMVAFDAQELAEGLFGDHMPTNLLLLGARLPARLACPSRPSPSSRRSGLNGAAGREVAGRLRLGPRRPWPGPRPSRGGAEPAGAPRPELDPRARWRSSRRRARPASCGGLLEIRVPPTSWGIRPRPTRAPYAADRDDGSPAPRRSAGAPGETGRRRGLSPAGLHKLMAYKDEYEVARLHLDAVESARRDEEFGSDAKVWFMLPPARCYARWG